MRIARTDQSLFGRWWLTIDRVLLASIFALLGAGLVLSLAASPAVAVKRGLPTFYFFERHLAFAAISAAVLIGISLLDPRIIRRLCLLMFVGGLVMMVAVLATGPEINGARRWIRVAGYSIQPSEFVKPAFVVLTAWLLSEREVRRDMPTVPMAFLSYGIFAGLLLLEPDVGQTLLITMVWTAMFFVAGVPLRWMVGFGGALAGIAGSAYWFFPHVRDRIHRFVDPASGDNYQVERALEAIAKGGLFGRGPGEGTVKTVLPDAHTDFILAVIAEEYGAIACLLLIGLIAMIVLKASARALSASDAFARNAVMGLTLLFGLQAMINMAVNAGLLPAKGMTLPFISYGGSSHLAIAIVMGFLIGLSRRGHSVARQKKSAILASNDQLRAWGGRFS